MSRAICDGCGKDSHIYMAIETDGEVNKLVDYLNYCLACGSYVAGVLTAIQRTLFKREINHE